MRADYDDEQSSILLSQKGVIPGFPHWSEKIPEGTQQEEIIKHYPNHLRGDLLLQIATFWSPKEISKTSGVPGLRANTITKRIKQAKIKKVTADRKSTARCKIKALAKQITANTLSNPAQPESLEQPFTESEASMKFRIGQQELLRIMEELDPTWTSRQMNRNRKRTNWDRELTERAAVERERRLGLSHDDGQVSVIQS